MRSEIAEVKIKTFRLLIFTLCNLTSTIALTMVL
jgi:hypothetical protein